MGPYTQGKRQLHNDVFGPMSVFCHMTLELGEKTWRRKTKPWKIWKWGLQTEIKLNYRTQVLIYPCLWTEIHTHHTGNKEQWARESYAGKVREFSQQTDPLENNKYKFWAHYLNPLWSEQRLAEFAGELKFGRRDWHQVSSPSLWLWSRGELWSQQSMKSLLRGNCHLSVQRKKEPRAATGGGTPERREPKKGSPVSCVSSAPFSGWLLNHKWQGRLQTSQLLKKKKKGWERGGVGNWTEIWAAAQLL